MASASSRVRLMEVSVPWRSAFLETLPAFTWRTFWPRLATRASIRALAPFPIPTRVTTAPTPIIRPRAVRLERSLLRDKARRATFKMVNMPIGIGRVLVGGLRFQGRCEFQAIDPRGIALEGNIADDEPVPER